MANYNDKTPSGLQKYAMPNQIKNLAETNIADDFFVMLAEELMLDDLLAGECDSCQFLKQSIVNVHNKMAVIRAQERLNLAREKANGKA